MTLHRCWFLPNHSFQRSSLQTSTHPKRTHLFPSSSQMAIVFNTFGPHWKDFILNYLNVNKWKLAVAEHQLALLPTRVFGLLSGLLFYNPIFLGSWGFVCVWVCPSVCFMEGLPKQELEKPGWSPMKGLLGRTEPPCDGCKAHDVVQC